MCVMAHDAFAATLERYLDETLHERIQLKEFEKATRLPAFLTRIYKFLEGEIFGRRCIILAARNNAATPSDIAKHVSLVRATVLEAIIAFAAWSLSAHNRS